MRNTPLLGSYSRIQGRMVVPGGGAVSYERDTPVDGDLKSSTPTAERASICEETFELASCYESAEWEQTFQERLTTKRSIGSTS